MEANVAVPIYGWASSQGKLWSKWTTGTSQQIMASVISSSQALWLWLTLLPNLILYTISRYK